MRVLFGGGVAGGDGGGLLMVSSKHGRFSPRQSITAVGEILSAEGINLVWLIAL